MPVLSDPIASSLAKFGGVIANVRGKYADTRSQANLSKMHSDASQDADVISESFSRIVQRRRRSELFGRISEAHLHSSPIWCSNKLEVDNRVEMDPNWTSCSCCNSSYMDQMVSLGCVLDLLICE
ncbi:hypothetical protein SASPL_126673 [Salvia splendens]|uniref:Uncharacterized protein n=1 Tax=Salvia splendens TaxID=180675 RepID=A0A8X8ZQ89_SALSN|nr:hypothetical protein SASPL_126673 [Salvia splendens]